MILEKALKIAEETMEALRPHCDRIEIAGSIRRRKPEVGDIEIVAIPKEYMNDGFFVTGIATVVNDWKKVKGELPCKYTQRILPQGIKLDLFFATPDNWGLIFAIRTGSADYSHNVLAKNWSRLGYKSFEGTLYFCDRNGDIDVPVTLREEVDLFNLLGIKYAEPENRNL